MALPRFLERLLRCQRLVTDDRVYRTPFPHYEDVPTQPARPSIGRIEKTSIGLAQQHVGPLASVLLLEGRHAR